MNRTFPKTLIAGLLLLGALTARADFDHGAWDDLLKAHVQSIDNGHSTAVDYAGMARDRAALKSYLDGLAAVDSATFAGWTQAAQLAFLINAYNAWTVELILSEWPDLDSIKDLGSLFRSPWKKAFIPLLGDTRSLDDIEHEMIRGDDRPYREPRIHFAVNCASIGCPALRAEAFRGADLERQLDEQTRQFLGDPSRNRYADGTFALSSIFKWYRKDFERGWQGYTALTDFLLDYPAALGIPDRDLDRVGRGDVRIEYLDYDWDLNGVR